MATRFALGRLARGLFLLPSLALLIAMGVLAARPSPLHAADFPCGSGDVGCLIDAINAANANPDLDTITLDGSTFSLSAVNNSTDGPNGLPSIASEVIIAGNGSIIERASGAAAHFRILHVSFGGSLGLDRVTIRNGSLPPSGVVGEREGGGILNIGILVLTNSTVTGNRAGDSTPGSPFAGGGGGISNRAGALVENSVIRGNRAGDTTNELADGGCGGGIFTANTLIGSTFINSFLEVRSSTVAENQAGDAGVDDGRGGDGGGLCVVAGADLDLVASTVSGNQAGKGFSGGDGGGLFVGSSAIVNIINSTFADNAAGGFVGDGTKFGGFGGAINVRDINATVNITNSTISGNRPGVVLGPGPSIVNGKGGALAINPSTTPNTVNVSNTIIYVNSLNIGFGEIFTDCTGQAPADLGYNIDSGTSCGFSAANNSLPSTDPRLSPAPFGVLADNGGPTATFALCTGPGTPDSDCAGASPALDAIPAGTNGCGAAPLDLDQRGLPRPVDGSGDGTARCDIGAFEVQTAPVAICGDGVVDADEACDDGNTADGDCCSSACQLESAATVCRPAAGACEVAATCTGTSAVCPANTFQPAGTACGDPAATACSSPDSCDGAGICQPNHRPDGTGCNDGNACTTEDTCAAGVCAGQTVTCLGQNATICGDESHNVLFGTDGPDVIHGLGGNDVIFGRGGKDLICGGSGTDVLLGEAGDDRFDGGTGKDVCIGGPGTDTFTGCEVRIQ